jgi:hypothetical protein
MLPADVTAAFISTKAALTSAFEAEREHDPIVISFLIILVLCPLYFRYVLKITNVWHRYFLVATSAVFAFSLANAQVGTTLTHLLARMSVQALWINPTVDAMAAVLPILWTLLISQIALSALGDKAVDTGISS